MSAKFELLQRPENYELTVQPLPRPGAPAGGPLVSQREYEALLAIYQAQNAIQIAQAEGVDTYAHTTLVRAEGLIQQAQQIPDRKGNRDRIVMLARQAVQTAEDARSIANQRRGGVQ